MTHRMDWEGWWIGSGGKGGVFISGNMMSSFCTLTRYV